MNATKLEAGYFRQSIGYALQSLLQDCEIRVSQTVLIIKCPSEVDPDDLIARYEEDFEDDEYLKETAIERVKISGSGRTVTLPLNRKLKKKLD